MNTITEKPLRLSVKKTREEILHDAEISIAVIQNSAFDRMLKGAKGWEVWPWAAEQFIVTMGFASDVSWKLVKWELEQEKKGAA